MSYSDLTYNAYVSFQLVANARIGQVFNNVQVVGGPISADIAGGAGNIDPLALHTDLFPSLPSGTPNKYDAYPYYVVKLPSGEVTAVGQPWIVENTITVQTTADYDVTVVNVSPERLAKLQEVLASNGFVGSNIRPA